VQGISEASKAGTFRRNEDFHIKRISIQKEQ
jgi:hypothetical protein